MKFAVIILSRLLAAVSTALAMSAAAFGQAPAEPASAPATEAAVRQLLEVTQARQVIDGMAAQMEGMLQGMIRQAVDGKTLVPEQQQILENMQADILGLFKAQMSWEALEPMMLEIYQQVFTQEEILGMLAFYQSPVGRSTIQKLPRVAQASMQRTQAQMRALMPRLRAIQREAIAQMEACCEAPAQPDSSGSPRP